MASRGFLGRPRLAEPKQVKTGVVSAAVPVSSAPVLVGEGAVDLPSRWHELQFALPRNRSYPAFSFAVSVYLPARNASNFEVKGLTDSLCSYALRDSPQ